MDPSHGENDLVATIQTELITILLFIVRFQGDCVPDCDQEDTCCDTDVRRRSSVAVAVPNTTSAANPAQAPGLPIN